MGTALRGWANGVGSRLAVPAGLLLGGRLPLRHQCSPRPLLIRRPPLHRGRWHGFVKQKFVGAKGPRLQSRGWKRASPGQHVCRLIRVDFSLNKKPSPLCRNVAPKAPRKAPEFFFKRTKRFAKPRLLNVAKCRQMLDSKLLIW